MTPPRRWQASITLTRDETVSLNSGVATGVLVGAIAAAGVASAQIAVSNGWVRAAPAGAPTAAAYVTLRNRGAKPDRLLGGTTPAAASLGVHSMSMAGAIMRMRRLDRGLPLAPGARADLQPGGDHLMLTGLTHPLKVGDRVPVTLRFERGGKVALSLPVLAAPPKPPG